MKKIILLLFLPLLLTSCAIKSYTPIIESSFCYDAKYIMGDFCFNCNVKKEDEKITVTVKDTLAEGLIICYDGQSVEFKKDEFSYTISGEKLDKSNPSILLSDVFEYVKANAQVCVQKTENGFKYTGTIPLGEFELYQNSDNEFYLITIPNANIRIELTKVDM